MILPILILLINHALADASTDYLLSPYLTVDQNRADEILVRWDVPEAELPHEHSAIFFAHGPISPASAQVVSYEWIAETTQSLHGDQTNVPEKFASRKPTILVREIGYLAGCRIGLLKLNFPTRVISIGDATADVVVPRGVLSIPFGHNDPDPFQSLPRQFKPVTDALILNKPLFQDRQEVTAPDVLPYIINPSVKCYTQKEGIYEVSADVLFERSQDTTIAVDAVAAFQNREAMPIVVVDRQGKIKTNGLLASSDTIRFYADRSASPFSPNRVTWIATSPQNHRTLRSMEKVPKLSENVDLRKIVRLEEDLDFMAEQKRNEEQSKYWIWQKLSEEPAVVSFQAKGNLASETASLTVSLAKEKKYIRWATESFRIQVNDQSLRTSIESSEVLHASFQTSIPSNLLRNGTNTIQVSYIENGVDVSANTVYLDWIEIDYPCKPHTDSEPFQLNSGQLSLVIPSQTKQTWAVSKAKNGEMIVSISEDDSGGFKVPSSLSNFKVFFLASGDCIAPSTIEQSIAMTERSLRLDDDEQTDFICILPRDWISTLQPFVNDLKTDGYTVRAISVEDIYDLFGDGRLDPHAIRDFVRYAFHHWQKPQPSYVFLIGDATWDYWGRYRNGIVNFIPAYQPDGKYAVDNWYVRCDREDDPIPDMVISRWPLRNAKELSILIDKNRRFKENMPLDDWLNRVFVLTDDEFESYTGELIDKWIPNGFQVIERHITDYPLVDNIYLPERYRARLRAKTSLVATENIIQTINDGVLFWQYFGHGAPNVLGKQRMFFGGGSKFSDVKKLKGNMKPNILWAFSCETTRFDYPREKWNISIGEDLLLHPTGGSIAMLGATGRGYPQDHIHLARGMHEAAFRFQLPTFGLQYFAAQLIGTSLTKNFEPVDQFIIFGDPTLPMPKYKPILGTIQQSNASFHYDWQIPGEIPDIQQSEEWLEDGNEVKLIENVELNNNETVSGSIRLDDLSHPEQAKVGFQIIGKDSRRPIVAHGAFDISQKSKPAPFIQPSTGKLPDLTFEPGSLHFEPASPRSGETVFIHAKVKNEGVASASDVNIKALNADSPELLEELKVTVGHPGAKIDAIHPGGESDITIRWDPVGNAGNHTILFEIDPQMTVPEGDETNNSIQKELDVRTKADLVIDATHVTLGPTPDGSRTMLSFEIVNQGESPAERMLVHLILKRPGREPATLILPRDPQTGLGNPVTIEPGDSYKARGIGLPGDFESIEIIADPDKIIDEETHENNRFEYSPITQ